MYFILHGNLLSGVIFSSVFSNDNLYVDSISGALFSECIHFAQF